MEVVPHGPGYTTIQVRVQVNQADDTVQNLSEVRARPGWSPHAGPQDEQGLSRSQTSICTLSVGPLRPFPLAYPQSHDKAIWIPLPPSATQENGKTLLTYLWEF